MNDSLSLVILYNATDGQNWYNTWDLSQPMDTWHGVILGNYGCVEELHLNENNLNGNIPPELGNLSELKVLNWDDNYSVTGMIPPELSNLSKLEYMNLSAAQLSGNIPVELTTLSNLTYFNLGANQLTGAIPPEVGSMMNLVDLYLYGNQLTGYIPAELGNLNNLENLYLLGNNLTGCYDPNLSNLCTAYVNIDSGNTFDALWADFCNNESGMCQQVWPGDFNADGIADNNDLLYWGLATGNTGNIRPNSTTDWMAQNASTWQLSVGDINSIHQDADGNGVVDIMDLPILMENYNNIHTILLQNQTASTHGYRLETLSGELKADTVILRYNLYLNDDGSSTEAHGIAAKFDFGNLLVVDALIDVSASSLEPDEYIQVFDTIANKLEIALTRTDRTDRTCIGPIGVVEAIVIEENLPTGGQVTIGMSQGQTIKADGTQIPVNGMTFYDTYKGFSLSDNDVVITATVTHAQCNLAGTAEVQITGGVSPYNIQWNTGATTTQISNLSAGIYTVTVSDVNGEVNTLSVEVEGQYLPVYDEFGNLIPCAEFDCPTVLDFTNNLPSGTHQASAAVNTNAQVASGDTHQLKAGNVILLQPGFSVPSDSNISVEIEDCEN